MSCAKKLWFLRTPPEEKTLRASKISKRMKQVRKEIPNPMESPETRAKVAEAMRQRGDPFTEESRGGNGRESPYEKSLLLALTRLRPLWLWSLGYAVSLGKRQAGYPTNYKADIASVRYKIAVEVDGASHRNLSARVKDQKKDEKLRELGWFVLRCSNKEIMEDVRRTARRIVNTCIRSLPRLGAISQTGS